MSSAKPTGGYGNIAAFFHTISFIITLFIQKTDSPLGGAWLPFFIAGCVALLYNRKYPPRAGLTWLWALAWLLTISASAFFFAPVVNAAHYMWCLSIFPALALCMAKEVLPLYFKCFGSVVLAYAVGIDLQKLILDWYMGWHYVIDYAGLISWPLLDPNNGALVLNTGLIPAFYMAMNRDRRWWLIVAVFTAAMVITGSKAGIAMAVFCCIMLTAQRLGWEFLLLCSGLGAIALGCIIIYRLDLILLVAHSFGDRLPIWYTSAQLLHVRPWLGLGIGRLGFYYMQLKPEAYWTFAHNDVLQFAVELGVPAAAVFVCLFLSITLSTCKRNFTAALVLLAIFMQSMVEFQFYIHAVSMLAGLALGYHLLNRRDAFDDAASPFGLLSLNRVI